MRGVLGALAVVLWWPLAPDCDAVSTRAIRWLRAGRPPKCAATRAEKMRAATPFAAGAARVPAPSQSESRSKTSAHLRGLRRSPRAVVPDESRLERDGDSIGAVRGAWRTHPADLQLARGDSFSTTTRCGSSIATRSARTRRSADIRCSYRVHSARRRRRPRSRDAIARTSCLVSRSESSRSCRERRADIRDTPGENFAQVETLRFRSRALQLAALGLGALGAMVLVPALLAMTRLRTSSTAEGSRITTSAVRRRWPASLTAVKGEARGGWTVDLASRAAASTRLAASSALDRRIPAPGSERLAPTSGRLSVRRSLATEAASPRRVPSPPSISCCHDACR